MKWAWRCYFNIAFLSLALPKCESCMVYKSEGGVFEDVVKRAKRTDSVMDSSTFSPAGKNELSEAKCKKTSGDGVEMQMNKRELPRMSYMWLAGSPRQRLEIHPNHDSKVTLTQIENECEESMRKQFKENQHKKKLQFSFIGKRNNTAQASPGSTSESLVDNLNNSESKDILREETPKGEICKQGSDNRSLNVKRWASTDESSMKDKNDLKESEGLKNNYSRSDKTMAVNENNILAPESKPVLKEITNFEDQDVKLLKILYEGLNSQQGNLNEVQPLVQALKGIADRRVEINSATKSTKPVSQKLDQSEKLKNVKSLLRKINSYKSRHQERKAMQDRYGSSPLNPNLINSKSFSFLPSKSIIKPLKPDDHSSILSKARKLKFSNTSPPLCVNTNESELTVDTKSMNNEINKEKSDYFKFVSIIDKILSNINSNCSQTNGLFNDLNKELLGNKREQCDDTILRGLMEEIAAKDASLRGCDNALESEEGWRDLLRHTRQSRTSRDKYSEGQCAKIRSSLLLNHSKASNEQQGSSVNSSNKHGSNNRIITKADELKRLQKVATELKMKIDDLLSNLEGTVGEDEEEDEEEEDDDDEDEEVDDETITKEPLVPQSSRVLPSSSRMSKANDDSYDSFKKFKPPVGEITKDKDKGKAVGKKQNIEKYDAKKDSKNQKNTKLRRDKRDRGILSLYYNAKSKLKDNNHAENVTDNLQEGIREKYNSISLMAAIDNENDESNKTFQVNDYFKNNITLKNSENNFDVFKVVGEYNKMHQDRLERENDKEREIMGFNTYSNLGENQQILGVTDKNVDSINLKSYLRNSNIKSIYSKPRIKSKDTYFQPSKSQTMSLTNNNFNEKQNIGRPLSKRNYSYTRNNNLINNENHIRKIQGNQPPICSSEVKMATKISESKKTPNYQNNIQLFNKNVSVQQLHRFKRTLKQLLDYLKPKGKKYEQIVIKTVSKEANETAASSHIEPKEISTQSVALNSNKEPISGIARKDKAAAPEKIGQ